MREFVIMTDSGSDLAPSMVEQFGIQVVPMSLTIAGKAYKHFYDFRELGLKEFYEKIRSGHIGTTAGVSVGDVMESMRECLKKGLDVLYLSFSSGMSCSYQSAALAAEDLKDEYPESNIHVIDTASGSVGLAMLTYLAAKKKEMGENIHQVAEYIKNHCKNICHHFLVDDLKYIQKTGRISHLTALVGTMLGMKPLFKIDDNGKVASDGKIRGRKAGLNHLVTRVKEKCTDPSLFFICHADAEDDARKVEQQIKEQHPDAEIHVNSVGPLLGNNTGPGAIAVIFYGDTRA